MLSMLTDFIIGFIVLNIVVTILLFIDGMFCTNLKEIKKIFKYVYLYGNIFLILYFIFEDHIIIVIYKIKIIVKSLLNFIK